MIKDRLGQVIFGTNTHHREMPVLGVRAGEILDYRLTLPANLGPGGYFFATPLANTDTRLVNNYE